MIFIWSTNGKIGSRTIRWGLDEDCSHFAISFFEHEAHTCVLESRLSDGVSICSWQDFQDRNQIVHMLQVPVTEDEEIEIYTLLRDATKGRKYDQRAILFWLYVGIKKKLFGTPIPKHNPMDRNEFLYCVEILEELDEDLLDELDIPSLDLDTMISPHMAYVILSQSQYLRKIV